ncbi:MAG TPA: glycosyltransferase [Gaiellaceae bacterium]|nr:glycosyltransferase [Gaiellaceae bacterium]
MSRSNLGGGAEQVATNLHAAYRRLGHEAELDVDLPAGRRRDGIAQIKASSWLDETRRFALRRGWPRTARVLRMAGNPNVALDALRGREDFRFPATRNLVQRAVSFDIAQLHNLHGGYFDLRLLPALARSTTVVLSPHDMWLATGHCAHSIDGDRWCHGCGSCPHLRTYPALLRDGTAENLRIKAEIYRDVRVHVAVPSHWLASVIERSVLAPSIRELKVIPNGIDLDLFAPGHRDESRRLLAIDPEEFLIVHTSQGGRSNEFKDIETFEQALDILADGDRKLTVLLLGDPNASVRVTRRVTVRSVGRCAPGDVPGYLQAADLYVHVSKAETFPLAILEALACGVPVVATAVGGIPEQITPRTGLLVEPREPRQLARAICELVDDRSRRRLMAIAAAEDARERFGLDRQATTYLGWFTEILA